MLKRRIAALMTAVLLVGNIAGCSGSNTTIEQEAKESTNSVSPETEVVNAPEEGAGYKTTYGDKMFDNITITVELFDRSNAPSGSTITDNKWVDYVNQEMNKVGINVEFVPVPRSDEIPKMQTMMASGTAPDITVTYSYANAEEYYKQGGTWDLSPFIDGEDQARNMKAYLGEDVINIARTPDNVLYGVVAKRAVTQMSNMYIRKDWLDALGLDIPKTTDELYNAIEQMVKNNPDGRTDVIGAILWMPRNLQKAFSKIVNDPVKADVGNPNVGFGADAIGDYYDEGIRDYYRFVNKMYNEGLLDKEYYTMDEDTFKSKVVNGSVACFESNVNYAEGNNKLTSTLKENIPTAELVSIPSLLNVNDGKQYSAAYQQGGLVAFCPLSASEEKVEACMTYLDWMCTKEGGFVLFNGFEGEHYKLEDGVPIAIDIAYNQEDKDWIRTDIFLVGNSGYFDNEEDAILSLAKEVPEFEQQIINNYHNAASGTLIYETSYTSPSTTDLVTDLKLIRDEYIVKCITCPEAEFESTFDTYMEELKNTGMDTIIQERTEYFESMHK